MTSLSFLLLIRRFCVITFTMLLLLRLSKHSEFDILKTESISSCWCMKWFKLHISYWSELLASIDIKICISSYLSKSYLLFGVGIEYYLDLDSSSVAGLKVESFCFIASFTAMILLLLMFISMSLFCANSF